MWGLDPVWGCCPTSTPALALPLVAPLGPGAKAKSQQLLAVLIGCRPAVQDGPRTKQPTVPSPPGAGQTPDSALGLHSILWSAKGMNPGGRARVRRDAPLLSHVLCWPACCGGQVPTSSAPPYPYHTGSPTMVSWLLVFFWGKKLFAIQRQRWWCCGASVWWDQAPHLSCDPPVPGCVPSAGLQHLQRGRLTALFVGCLLPTQPHGEQEPQFPNIKKIYTQRGRQEKPFFPLRPETLGEGGENHQTPCERRHLRGGCWQVRMRNGTASAEQERAQPRRWRSRVGQRRSRRHL